MQILYAFCLCIILCFIFILIEKVRSLSEKRNIRKLRLGYIDLLYLCIEYSDSHIRTIPFYVKSENLIKFL